MSRSKRLRLPSTKQSLRASVHRCQAVRQLLAQLQHYHHHLLSSLPWEPSALNRQRRSTSLWLRLHILTGAGHERSPVRLRLFLGLLTTAAAPRSQRLFVVKKRRCSPPQRQPLAHPRRTSSVHTIDSATSCNIRNEQQLPHQPLESVRTDRLSSRSFNRKTKHTLERDLAFF